MRLELKKECFFVLLVDLTELVVRLLHMLLALALSNTNFRNVNEPNLKMRLLKSGKLTVPFSSLVNSAFILKIS